MKRKLILLLTGIILLVALDQITKYLVFKRMVIGSSVVVHASDVMITGSVFYITLVVYLAAVIIGVVALVRLITKK